MGTSQLGGLSLPEVEQRIEKIWRDVLGVKEGRADETFFELRGQSISAVRIASRIEEELGISMDVGELFEDPDLETFVRKIAARAEAARAGEAQS
ncbi:MAG: mdpC2 [Sphaerisporangium sp.]|jgi:acyl carrier protein|nr:mdpC2 [Sphaerisporangium sp.]